MIRRLNPDTSCAASVTRSLNPGAPYIGDTSSEPIHALQYMVDMISEPGRLSNDDGNTASQPGRPLRDSVDMSSDVGDTTWLTPRLNPDAC